LLVENFDISQNEAGHIAGTLGFYSDLMLVSCELILGYSMDLFGRKGLSLAGYLIAAAALITIPYMKTIYPGVLLCRMSIAIGILPSLATPLHVDYVATASMGAVNGWFSVIEACG